MRWIPLTLAILLATAPLGMGSSVAQPLPSRINVFKDAVDALGAAGDAVTKLTDGIAHLVMTGNKGWTYVSAQRAKSRLQDIVARSSDLISVQRPRVLDAIESYLSNPNPTGMDWDRAKEHFGFVLGDVKGILEDLRSERSDFVREETYLTFLEVFIQREDILMKIMVLPQPVTADDRAAVSEMNARYRTLVDRTRTAIGQLNIYLSKIEPT